MHCITCAVLKMFMHFRRVITMLKCCVLVGFDWTEPMILLMLHVTCSCILHAYVLIFVSIIWYKTIWFFSVCVSLSFFRSVASFFASPSDSTPSHIRFHDDKARKDFSKNFSWRGFHLKCQVILSDFSNTDLPTIIYSEGQGSLCDILVTYPSVIIQEFYSNMHKFDTFIPHFSLLRSRYAHCSYSGYCIWGTTRS